MSTKHKKEREIDFILWNQTYAKTQPSSELESLTEKKSEKKLSRRTLKARKPKKKKMQFGINE